MPTANPFGLTGVADEGGFGADLLKGDISEAEKERRKRQQLQQQQQKMMGPVSAGLGLGGLGPVSSGLLGR